MSFVKGQKIICIDGDDVIYITKDKIYEALESDSGGVTIEDDKGWGSTYREHRFKTIIQSIEDVIPGMTLTHSVHGEVEVLENNGTYTVVEVIKKSETLNSAWHTNNLENFKEYKPKENQVKEKEYEVPNKFSIKDIWFAFKEHHSCKEFQKQWGDLMVEYDDASGYDRDFYDIDNVMHSEVLSRNLCHLEEKGLVTAIEKDVLIKAGMKFKVYGSESVWTALSDQSGNLMFSNGTLLFNECTILKVNEGCSLNELNRISRNTFEVIDD